MSTKTSVMRQILRWWLFAIPLLLPTALVRFSVGSIPFSLLELLVDGLFVVWALWMLLSSGAGGLLRALTAPLSRMGSLPQLLLLFFLAAVATWFVVPSEVIFNTGIKEHLFETYETRRIWLGILKGWLVPMVLYGHLLTTFLQSKEDRDEALAWSVIGACILAIVSLFSRYVLGIPDTLDGRLGGLYVSANYLVFLVAPAFVWSMQRCMETLAHQSHSAFWHRILAFVALPLLGITIVLARSYASWIVLALLGVFLVFRWLRGKPLIVAVVLMLAATVTISFTEVGSEKLRGFFTVDSQSSTSTRLEVYTISVALLQKHWLLGIGPGQYESQYITNAHDILGKTPYEWVMLHPHNLYLSIWLSLGLVGLIAFLGMLVMAAVCAWKERSLIALLPLSYLLMHGLVDTPFWKLDSMLLFVFLVASAYAGTSRPSS